jgi:hypothetical protein
VRTPAGKEKLAAIVTRCTITDKTYFMLLRMLTSCKYFSLFEDKTTIETTEFIVSRDIGYINFELNSQKFKMEIGRLLFEDINKSSFLFRFIEQNNIDSTKEFDAFIHTGRSFITFLWFVKDNCVSEGFNYYYEQLDKSKAEAQYKILLTDKSVSMSSGDFKQTNFSFDEIIEAINYHNIHGEKRKGIKKEKDVLSYNVGNEVTLAHKIYVNKNDTNRIDRAFLFLAEARTTYYLPFKISLYVVVFECLFTTGNTEVTHKVSERASFYIGGSALQKAENYKIVKSAYDLRSKYFHGQQLDSKHNNHEKQIILSKEVDELLRQVFRKVITEDYDRFLDNKNLENWLHSLVFNN